MAGSGGWEDDGDGGVVGKQEHGCASVFGAEVVHAHNAAEADLPIVTDMVVADAAVRGDPSA